jgi:hypothetical protein
MVNTLPAKYPTTLIASRGLEGRDEICVSLVKLGCSPANYYTLQANTPSPHL